MNNNFCPILGCICCSSCLFCSFCYPP
uniref:Uncharacterized protein n=1 Tax=Arundo donax TaxID=35708 RepID=A0A0A9A0F8_ARUDO